LRGDGPGNPPHPRPDIRPAGPPARGAAWGPVA